MFFHRKRVEILANRALQNKDANISRLFKLLFLSPKKVLKTLEESLNAHLSSVGILTFGGGAFRGPSSHDLAAGTMVALAKLSPHFPEEDQQRLKERFEELTRHNWGGVRRGAEFALTLLSPVSN